MWWAQLVDLGVPHDDTAPYDVVLHGLKFCRSPMGRIAFNLPVVDTAHHGDAVDFVLELALLGAVPRNVTLRWRPYQA
jgi:hypothetical protein